MKRSLLLLIAFFSSGVFATAPTEPLELVSFKKANYSANVEARVYTNGTVITLTLKNTTDKIVTAWKADMTVKDAFGETILQVKIKSNDSNIKPGGTENAPFDFEDNQFIDNEPYDEISPVSTENLKIEITGVKVVTKP